MSSDPSLSVRRADCQVIRPIPTRWMDNDHYGHVNNVAYYSFFDTAVNGFLLDATGTEIRALPAIGIVAESSCRFLSPVSFPDVIHAGLAIERMGARSIVYRIALFRNDDDDACAVGRFVHVYVDRDARRPVEIPDVIRSVVERLLLTAQGTGGRA
jgi:acyl-CoA thioester hydrolase